MDSSLLRRVLVSSLLSFFILLVISLIPTLLGIVNYERIVLSPVGLRISVERFVELLREGKPTLFYMGRTPRFLGEEMVRYGSNSAAFLIPATLLATGWAYLVPLAMRSATGRSPQVLAWLGVLPIFMVAMLIQGAAVSINLAFDRHVFTFAYLGGVSMPVLLPAITMLLPIAAFSLRASAASIASIAQSEYVRAAVGRAIRPRSLWFRHVGSGLLDRLEDLLPRTTATGIAALFITERVYNLPGITGLLLEFPYQRVTHRFAEGVAGTMRVTAAQFQLVAGAAATIVVLYVLSIAVSRLLIRAIRLVNG